MDYPIDYEHYTTEEIIVLVEFLSMVEAYHFTKGMIQGEALLAKYTTYQTLLNNKAEEKRIDAEFEKQTGLSIYKTIKTLKKSA